MSSPLVERPRSNVRDGAIHNTEPATGKPLPPLAVAGPDEVRAVVERAHRAQARWASLSWSERKAMLLAFRDRLVARTDEVADLLARENGKARFEALTHEIFPIADLTNYFAKRAKRMLADERIPLHLFGAIKRSHLRFEPRGVIGVISPWNFPFSIPMGDVVMALAARTAVVVKPSEWTPRILLLAKEIFVEAGLDPDLFGVVPGGGETGAALVESDVDMVIFTGSVATGSRVGEACGRRLIPYVAELGGKDAAIVLPDAPIEATARQVVWGAFANSGQVCASVERVLVHESIYEPFVAKVVELTRALRQGDPMAAGADHVDVGAMVVPSQLELVRRQVEDARAKGARILVGGAPNRSEGHAASYPDGVRGGGAPADGARPGGAPMGGDWPVGAPEEGAGPRGAPMDGARLGGVPMGGVWPGGSLAAVGDRPDGNLPGTDPARGTSVAGRFFPPTVLVDVTKDMDVWREETFGPCLPIRSYRDEAEAIQEANDTHFGLSAYVFSRDLRRAEAVAEKLEAGTVMINDVLYTHALPETPWGGVKQSGVGRVHGRRGLEELCEIRHVNRPRVRLPPLWTFPYREGRFRAFRWAMRRLFGGALRRGG